MPHDSDPDHPHSLLPPEPALRVQALETILRQKGLIDPDALAASISTYENDIGPQNGAKVVAKAWCDDEFRARLLDDPMRLCARLRVLLRGVSVRVSVVFSVRVSVRASSCARLRARVRARLRACVRTRLRACLRARFRARCCARGCARCRARAHV